jgi:hypothetical protein
MDVNYLLIHNLIKYSRESVGWDDVVGTVTVYGLEGLGIEFCLGVKFSAPVHAGCGAHAASC